MIQVVEFRTKKWILDGGLAVELERQGYDLRQELWSARALVDAPEMIQEAHKNYLLAGANIVTTASYQATLEGYAKFGFTKKESLGWIKNSVRLAKAAIKESGKKALVAGSLGPYGAFLNDGSEYTGKYAMSDSDFISFHAPRVEALAEADLIAIETQPRMDEARAAAFVCNRSMIPFFCSFTLSELGALPDGNTIDQIQDSLREFEFCIGFGFNCASPQRVMAAFEGEPKAFVAYPNSGEIYDAQTKTWAGDSTGFHRFIEWTSSKTQGIFGGCCQVGPRQISELAS